jgi:HEPN domain-containing protein
MVKQTNTPEDWRFLAERDMTVADHLANTMSPIPTEIIAFFCQQTVEKYLKGVLTILGEEPPYIHDLDDLCSLVEKHRPSFVHIASLCTIITQSSSQPRYDRGRRPFRSGYAPCSCARKDNSGLSAPGNPRIVSMSL